MATTEQPSRQSLTEALTAAAASHHDYETHVLKGERDQQWPGFYAAYIVGRLGDFVPPSKLNDWLAAVLDADDWPGAAADAILANLD